MTSSSYFRFPHVHGDLVTFVAEDDVWIAPLGGGRAWRVSSLQLPARNPRFTPDGKRLVWTVVQGTAPEVVTAEVDGGGYRQLTYFGHASTRVKGFTAGGAALVTSAFRQAESRHTYAYSVPVDGGWAEELPFGPVESVAFGPEVGDERPVVLASVLSREPAWWKRYRGGTAGKLWIDSDGNGEFERLVPELDGNLTDPMWVDGRIAFLSDHEGFGNLYSVLPGGGDLRRHTDHEDFYVRHAATDGQRIVFESAGELWVLHDLRSDAVRLDISLGSASQSRRPGLLKTEKHLGAVVPDATGSASAVEAHGTIHWIRHKDGPSRVVEATPGVRARLPRPLDGGRLAYIADHDGVEALYIKEIAAHVPGLAAAADAAPAPVPADAPADDAAASLPRPVPAAGTAARRPLPRRSRRRWAMTPGPTSHPLLTGRRRKPPRARHPRASPSPSPRAPAPWKRAPMAGGSQSVRPSATSTSRTPPPVNSPSWPASARAPSRNSSWSADSRWLAWSEPVTSFGSRSRLRLVQAGAKEAAVVEVTDGRFCDKSPSFTPDGKFLAFLSNRSFDPVYDGHSFDLSFPSPIKPYLVALAADTPSPFGPAVDLDGAGARAPEATDAAARPGSHGLMRKAWHTGSSACRFRRATTPRSGPRTAPSSGWIGPSPVSPATARPARRTRTRRPAWSGSTLPAGKR